MEIAINGAGIAGPALAFWLDRLGHRVTLVEAAPSLRTGGYVIDFWGVGYEVARRMGLEQRIRGAGYPVEAIRLVDRDGRAAASLDTAAFARATGGRFTSLARGDLAAILFEAVKDRVETVLGDGIVALDQDEAGIRAAFARMPERRFDLVVGADGLHSAVRRIAFRLERQVELFLGYGVAAFELAGYRPRDELAYVTYGFPGRQLARFALRDDRTLFMFVFKAEESLVRGAREPAQQKAVLRGMFGGRGWECDAALAAMDQGEDFYFDRVSQIRMPCWSTGRVALIGDAAACVSLLAGEGSGLAMAEAYMLTGELDRAGGDHRAAFAAWEARLRPLLATKQESAKSFASYFAPSTRIGLAFRMLAIRAMRMPWLADLVIGRSLRDDLVLPDYGLSSGT